MLGSRPELRLYCIELNYVAIHSEDRTKPRTVEFTFIQSIIVTLRFSGDLSPGTIKECKYLFFIQHLLLLIKTRVKYRMTVLKARQSTGPGRLGWILIFWSQTNFTPICSRTPFFASAKWL